MYSSRKYFEKFPIVCKVLQRFLTFDLNHPDSQKKTRLTTRQYQNKGDSSTKVCSTNRPGWINGSVAATSSVLIMHSPRSVFVKVHQITLAGIDEPVKQIDVPQSPACVKILRPGAVAHTHTHTFSLVKLPCFSFLFRSRPCVWTRASGTRGGGSHWPVLEWGLLLFPFRNYWLICLV